MSLTNINNERKQTMKKILAIALVLVLCLSTVALASCEREQHQATEAPPAPSTGTGTGSGSGSGAGSDQGTPGEPPLSYDVVAYDGSEVTITFSHTMNQTYQGVLDKYIAKFNEMYPNITVEHAQVGGYDDVRDQIKTELTAGNQPNIAYCYPDHVALYNVANAVIPLNSFIDSTIEITDALGNVSVLGFTEEQKNDFIPGFYAEGAVFDNRGTMYTLPMSKSTEVLYYNKTFFDQHGLKVPTTWDEMEALCAQILAIDGGCIPLGYDSEANWFITMTEQYGSDYTSTQIGRNFLFNNDTNKAFVKRFRSWYEAGYVTTQALYGAYTSGLFTETAGKNSYMSIGSTGGAMHQVPAAVDGVYPFEVGIAPIPQIDPANPKAISQGPSLCIFKDTNKQEEAASWLFVEFLTTNKEFQAEFSMTSGYMPVIKSVSDLPGYANYLASANGSTKLTALAVKVGIEMENYYFVSPAFNGSSKARDKVGELMQYCFVTPASDVDAMLNEAFKAAVVECTNSQ